MFAVHCSVGGIKPHPTRCTGYQLKGSLTHRHSYQHSYQHSLSILLPGYTHKSTYWCCSTWGVVVWPMVWLRAQRRRLLKQRPMAPRCCSKQQQLCLCSRVSFHTCRVPQFYTSGFHNSALHCTALHTSASAAMPDHPALVRHAVAESSHTR